MVHGADKEKCPLARQELEVMVQLEEMVLVGVLGLGFLAAA